MTILLEIALRHLAFLWFSSPPEGKKIFGREFLVSSMRRARDLEDNCCINGSWFYSMMVYSSTSYSVKLMSQWRLTTLSVDDSNVCWA